MIRIIPSFDGYEVWQGERLVVTTRSFAAAREEQRILLCKGIEVNHTEDDGSWDFINAQRAASKHC